ncbi:hypothetical protein [Mucilaginibacter pedocola]|uniref:Uncharacterized protein n=1 Tax=Mucilaginibacter pedocola TaxID=1792845 RepID=A0A1S9P839_9SPHI|nr:hypothetical protein [Mucilaginibacter pedocola]OOQ57116.1 hypothetical protein BC343_16475 [Mucilaginibacter pedocola]
MIEQLETIIKLLTEINDKLTPAAPAPSYRQAKKLTKKQEFLQEVMATVEARYRKDEIRAEKMFAPEIAELAKRKHNPPKTK